MPLRVFPMNSTIETIFQDNYLLSFPDMFVLNFTLRINFLFIGYKLNFTDKLPFCRI